MAKCDAITPLMAAMRKRGDVIHTCAETIKKMFELSPAELVVQVKLMLYMNPYIRIRACGSTLYIGIAMVFCTILFELCEN